MIGQIIKQPNGKYCIFNSVVDNITYYDMTADEIINDSSMPERVRRAIDELEEGGKPYFQFTLTFDEMLERIKQVHGRDELDRVIELVRPRKRSTNMQRGDIFKKHSDKLGLLWTSEQWETVMAAMCEFAEQEVKNYPAITVSEIFGVFHRDEDENLSLIDLYLSETDAEERKAQLYSYPSFGKWFGPEQIGYRDRRLVAVADIETYTGMVWLPNSSKIRGMATNDPTLSQLISQVDEMGALLMYPYPNYCWSGRGTFEVQKHVVI